MSEAGTPASAAAEANTTSVCATASASARRMPSKGKKRLPLSFHGQKAFAWAEGLHQHCLYVRCRRLKKCTGEPRGTFRKYGKPHCKTPDAKRLIRQKIRRIEERNRIRELERYIPQKR